jgi:ketosteroid isomerase-like protein
VTSAESRNTGIVRGIYEASFAGDVEAFTDAMHEDFEESVPPVLPWGGVHRGREAFLTNVLPLLVAAVDFASMELVSLSGEGDRVAALLRARSVGGDELWIAEHWTMREGKAWRLMVFYHDATPLMPSTSAA